MIEKIKKLFRSIVNAYRTPEARRKSLPLTLLALLGIASFFCAALLWYIIRIAQSLPTVSQLQNIEQPLASRVLDKDGRIVCEFGIERRNLVSLDKIPLNLQNAVIAIEDRKFYKHWGLDLRRLFQAAIIDVVRREYAQGASTITQQLARNLYLSSKSSMERKIREALTAVQLESYYTKRQILELYLNQVCFGGGAWGVESASRQYFNKPVTDLSLNECATLAGIIQTPERFPADKKENLRRSTTRREPGSERHEGDESHRPAHAQGGARSSPPCRDCGPQSLLRRYFKEMVRKHVADRFGDDLLYNGGLTIYSTLDLEGQTAAESAVDAGLASLQQRLNQMFLDGKSVCRKYNIH